MLFAEKKRTSDVKIGDNTRSDIRARQLSEEKSSQPDGCGDGCCCIAGSDKKYLLDKSDLAAL